MRRKFVYQTPRKYQLEIVQLMLDNLDDYDNFVVTAPTGTGKSVLAITMSRFFASSFVVTHRRKLQVQYAEEFRVPTMMGRSSYECRGNCGDCPLDAMCRDKPCNCGEAPCVLFPMPREGFEDDMKQSRLEVLDAHNVAIEISHDHSLMGFNCKRKMFCQYFEAKKEAMQADHVVLGSKYSLIDAMYSHTFAERQFVCFDEAHTLEDDLLGLIEISVRKSMLDDLGITPDFDNWGPTFEKLGAMRDVWFIKHPHENVQKIRDYVNLMNRAKDVALIYDKDTWVCQTEKRRRGITYDIKPIWATSFGKSILPTIAKKRMYMSATLDANLLVDTLGLDSNRTLWINIDDSPFPVQNRLIKCSMTGDLARKSMDTDLPKVLAELQKICDAHPDDRILVLPFTHAIKTEIDKVLRCPQHVDVEKYRMQLNEWCAQTYDHSTAMQQYLSERISLLKYDRRIHASDNYRLSEIDLHVYETVPASVMLSTYLTSGYDGRDDRCRVLVIPKIPYGDLSDQIVKRRLEQNPRWYQLNTIQTLVQMLGRAVRSETDYADIYVLDKQMGKLYQRSKDLFPKYILDAIRWRKHG